MLGRGIMIHGDLWTYTVGETNVIIQNPLDKQRYSASLGEVTGLVPEKLRELQKTGKTDKVCPASAIKRYIERRFLRPR